MKKVLIFSLAYYPNAVSGAEAAIKEITDRICDIEFHLITLRFDPIQSREERIGNVVVHRVGRSKAYLQKMLFLPLAAKKGAELARTLSLDAAWSVMTYMLFPVMLMRFWGVRLPHILTLQDGDPYDKVFNRWFIRPFTPILDAGFRHAAIVQAISSYLAKWPSRRGYTGEVVVIPNGANPRDVADDVPGAAVEALREKLGKKSDDVWLINTARLVHQKGNDATVRALPSLPQNVKLVLVGAGPDEAMLKTLAHNLGVADRVIFTGQVDRTEVTSYRKAADIFVGPSRSEGLGNAFLSAMASRLPVVATQEGGIAEFLFDETRSPGTHPTGWAVDKDAPEQIAKAVKDILAHPEKVRTVTERARRMVVETYNWDSVARRMRDEVFAKVV